MADSFGPHIEPPIRLTLRWVLGAMGLVLATGFLGGLTGQQLLAPPLPPLAPSGERIISTVQEVTISPNTAAAQLVETADNSVVLLATQGTGGIQKAATGVVVTNDGLVVSTADLRAEELVALDDQGAPVKLDRVGSDDLYGLAYWRMAKAVAVPLDLRRETVSVGTELLAVSRSDTTLGARVMSYRIQELSLPRPDDPPGIQQVWLGETPPPALMTGAPLLDEDGRLAGLVLDTTGRAVGADVLDISLRRVASGQRELNAFTNLGLSLQFGFVSSALDQTVSFAPKIITVTPQSPAAQAGIRAGDVLVRVGETPIDWPTNVAQQLSAALPLKVAVERGSETITMSIQAIASN